MKALWADTAFLAGQGVMDYSLIVGVDTPNGALVVGIIDFLRQVCIYLAYDTRLMLCYCGCIAAPISRSLRAAAGVDEEWRACQASCTCLAPACEI